MSCVTCMKCGWVHMLVSREFAEESVRTFNDFYNTLSVRDQLAYYSGRKADISEYERCFRCGSTEPMRPEKPGDCPIGCTIQPTVLCPA